MAKSITFQAPVWTERVKDPEAVALMVLPHERPQTLLASENRLNDVSVIPSFQQMSATSPRSPTASKQLLP